MNFWCSILLITNFLICVFGMSATDQRNHPNFKLLPKAPDCSNPVSFGRIVGGYETLLGQYPWLGRLGFALGNCPEYENDVQYYDCGGSLITPNMVLTAAHCVLIIDKVECPTTYLEEAMIVATVKLGVWDQNNTKTCINRICAEPPQIILARRSIPHPGYLESAKYNDIALVELETPAEITAWVNPVCLPMGFMLRKDFIGEMAEVVGWGRTHNDKDKKIEQNILKAVDIPILQQYDCKSLWGDSIPVPPSIICAGGEAGEDSCNGDSGGPLMLYDDEGGYETKYMIGLVSFGPVHCGTTDDPGAYTRITSFMEWILDNLD